MREKKKPLEGGVQMNELQVFKNDAFGEVRVLVKERAT